MTVARPRRPAKPWALTQLGKGTSLTLTIDDYAYDVTQFTCSYAVNEVPSAQCLLAVGRNVNTLQKAQIHNRAATLRQLKKARVTFNPVGEYRPDGTPWPAGPFTIFDGYFMGLAYTKINGKAQVIANLRHWLVDLACSSCLTQNSHPGNPVQWTARAVGREIAHTDATAAHYISDTPGIDLVASQCTEDFWGAIKKLFCGLANIPAQVGATEQGGGIFASCRADVTRNDRARRALIRLEGPADLFAPDPAATAATTARSAARQILTFLGSGNRSAAQTVFQEVAHIPGMPAALAEAKVLLSNNDTAGAIRVLTLLLATPVALPAASAAPVNVGCSTPYVYGVPLTLNLLAIPDAETAVANAVMKATIESYASTTFWDKLIASFCPQFFMAVVPCVEFGLVIADLPAYRGNAAGQVWKDIVADEYDSFQQQAELDHPLRAIGVVVQTLSNCGQPESTAGAAGAGSGGAAATLRFPMVGGCFGVNIDTADPEELSDGLVRHVPAPHWLQALVNRVPYVSCTTGLPEEQPSRSESTPAATGGTLLLQTPYFLDNINRLLNRYAQSVYVAHTLRGSGGVLGGKLRFDIAPGSVVRIKASEEKFLRGEDDLAIDIVACVGRVTIAINAEAGRAGTTFALTHLRTDTENQQNRTSVAAHPLFDAAIHGRGRCGAPLIAGHEDL